MARQASSAERTFVHRARCAARRLHGLARDDRGVSMLEFGLFLPILAMMILATIDLANGLAMKFSIEQATQRTIEIATLGGRPRADYSFLRTEAATAADVPVAQVTLDQWLECDDVRQASFTGACSGTQQSARYVTISVYKDFTPTFDWIPFVSRIADANGKVRLTADSGVRVQ